MENKKVSTIYKIIIWLIKVFFPKYEAFGTDNIPKDEPVIIVGNHSQMNGPILSELYFPIKHYTWCAGEMMNAKEIPAYAYRDFWEEKPKTVKWFYKLLSYLIVPLAVCIFNNANTIAVYHDTRVFHTFKTTVSALKDGISMVIFPEHKVPHNNIIYEFQNRFVDIARLYYKSTGKELAFVPLYIAPTLKKYYFGRPIRFCAENAIENERKRITDTLMSEITDIARNLPEHTVVPYCNIPKKDYPSNLNFTKDNESVQGEQI